MPRRTRTAQSSGSPTKYKQQTLLSHFSSSPPAPTRRRDTNSKRAGRNTQTRLQDSGSEVEIVESSPPKRVNRQRLRRSNSIAEGSDSSDVGKIHFEPQSSSGASNGAAGSSSGGDSEPLSPSRPVKRPRVLKSESEGSGAEVNRPRNGRLRRLPKRGREEESDSRSEEDRKPKGRLIKKRQPSTSNDEEDILSGIDEDKIIHKRLRGKQNQRSRFMRNLERLKNKKRGHAISESDSEEASDDGSLIPGARRAGEAESETSVQEDDDSSGSEERMDDFIVEDEGNAPTATLPAIFSMNTHQDLVHHFKVVCQYYVHLAVTTYTARARIAKRLTSDEYFSVPLSIARRKLADIRDSIASSVWRPDYKKALMKYPEFALNDLNFAIPACDACHLGGRLSTLIGRLGGNPYDRTTFEAVNSDSESSSDDADDEGQTPPEYNLGRFCARRTSVFHELCHWEYAVFTALSREVEALSNNGLGYIRVGYAEGVQPPEDISDADQVMEWLDRRDVINFEWLRIKELISRATNLDADVKRGEKD